MRDKTAKKLLLKVTTDYNQISTEFHITRKHDWKEFEMFLPYIENNQKIADLGCGNGRFYKFISEKRDVNYLGIDNSKKLLEKAQESFPKAKFVKGDLLKLPLKEKKIDVAVAIASIHHIPSKKLRQKAIQEMNRILKENGLLIITVWNLFQPNYKKYIWKARLRKLLSLGQYDSRDTLIPWGKTGVKRYYYAFKQSELRQLLEKNNFKIIQEDSGNNFLIIAQKI